MTFCPAKISSTARNPRPLEKSRVEQRAGGAGKQTNLDSTSCPLGGNTGGDAGATEVSPSAWNHSDGSMH
jgi:hypothetical protein